MRKIFVLFIVIIFLTVPSVTFANIFLNNEINFSGVVYSKNTNDEFVEEFLLENVKVKISENVLIGSLNIGGNKSNFSADKIKEVDGISYYIGELIIDSNIYNCDIIKNKEGLSILYYDDKKEFVRTIVLTTLNEGLEDVKNKIKDEVAPVIREQRLINDIKIESSNDEISLRSYPVNRTHHIYKDSLYIPLVIDGGTVEGFFHYQTNIDPSAEFYAVDMDAVINWVTGFDGITITNVDEVYGVFWGTPDCPTKNLQTFQIGMMAEKQSPYKIKATVSYHLLVGKIPVLYWSSDEEYLNY